MVAITKALAEIECCCAEISDQQTTVEDSIHLAFRQLKEALSVRETDECISQLHLTTQTKLKNLAAQRDRIETTLAQQSSCLYFVRESLKTGSEKDALRLKTSIQKQVKELTTPFLSDFLKPITEADTASAEVSPMCQTYGQVLALDSTKFHIAGKGVRTAVAGVISAVTLQAYDIGGSSNLGGRSCELLQAELVSEITGAKFNCNIEGSGQGQCELSYQPIVRGNHQLHIKMEGQHVEGSPFTVVVKSFEKLGAPILTLKANRPAIGRRGEIIVSEVGRRCVSVFSHSGKKSFGSQMLYEPHGVTVDGEGNIFVVDVVSEQRCIHKFTAEGCFMKAVGTKGSGPLQFSDPTDIAFSASNNMVYVTDTGIQVLNSDLTFSSLFGKKGNGKGQFRLPSGLACDSTGKVYVADRHIQKFSADGKFLRMFSVGTQERDFPTSIAVGTNGRVYVSKSYARYVAEFNSEGQLEQKFLSRFEFPCALSFRAE